MEAIRNDARLSDDERLDRADEIHETALTAHNGLVEELQTEISDRLSSIDKALFGAPGLGLVYDQPRRTVEQNGFRDALLRLFGADEERLSEAVQMAGLTGDTQLLRAARAVGHRQGFDEVVRTSVFAHGTRHERERYVERIATPSEGNLGIITRAYAPARANLAALTPDLATQQAARDQDRAREARRQVRRG